MVCPTPYAHDSIAQFLDALGRRTPAPASGSALAVAAAIAAALVELTARFSNDDATCDAASGLRGRLLVLADEDAAAYTQFMETKTDEARARTIEVPQAIADYAEVVSRLAGRLELEGNPNLVGDATAARLLAHAAQQAAARLVELNRAAG